MKYLLISFCAAVMLSSCKETPIDQSVDPTRFPDTLNTVKSSQHKRIPGTKIFALIPDSYSFSESKNQFTKSESTFMQVVEPPVAKFSVAKESFTREYIEDGGAKVDIVRPILFNGYEGVFLDGPAKGVNRRKASVVFGDEEFVCLVFGEYPGDSPEDRTEMLDIFRSMVYDKTQKVEKSKAPYYDFDLSITGFKPAVISEQVNIYNIDGKAESERSLPTSMNFAPIPVLPDEAQRMYFEQLIEESQQGNLKITPANTKKTTVNGMPATVIETTVVSEGKTGIFYAAILNGQRNAVVFISSAFDDPGKRIGQYKATLQSIRFK